MRVPSCVLLLGFCSLALAIHAAQQAGEVKTFWIGFPGEAWSLELQLTGFEVQFDGMNPDGRRYFLATNLDSHVTISFFLEKVSETANAKECESWIKKKEKEYKPRGKKFRKSEVGEWAVLEFELEMKPFTQRNLWACRPEGQVYVDAHVSWAWSDLSAVLHPGRSTPDLTVILRTLRTVPIEPGIVHYFLQGVALFREQKFEQAIEVLNRALEVEKTRPQLDLYQWRELVGRLAMSYAFTGQGEWAKETFQYGLSKDPTNVIFHYYFACVYALLDDLENTMLHLRRAFEYKDKFTPEEKIPDPWAAHCFKEFRENPEFRKLLAELTGKNPEK